MSKLLIAQSVFVGATLMLVCALIQVAFDQDRQLKALSQRFDLVYRRLGVESELAVDAWTSDVVEVSSFTTMSTTPARDHPGCVNTCMLFGIKGRDGKNVSCSDCPPGPQGIQGLRGFNGTQGIQGIQGFNGTDGIVPVYNSTSGLLHPTPKIWYGMGYVAGSVGLVTIPYTNVTFSNVLWVDLQPIHVSTTNNDAVYSTILSYSTSSVSGRMVVAGSARYGPAGTLVLAMVVGT